MNPAAGRGRGIALWHRVERELLRHGYHTSTVLTSAPWDGERLARAAIGDGVDTIVAVGGDGTVHEIVNGFFEDRRLTPQVKLAILPSGTGMDFARNLRIRRGVRAAVDRILSGEERRVDVGLVPDRGRVFVNFAETGLGAAVVAREREYSSAWPGRASFFMAAVAAALDEDNVVVRISIDGSSVYEGPVVSVVVANGRYFGGGMKIAPRASMDDGLLDVFVLGDFTRLERVSQIWKIYPGVHVGLSKVLWKRAQTVEIEPVGPSRLDLDGELLGGGAVRLALLPASLRVVA